MLLTEVDLIPIMQQVLLAFDYNYNIFYEFLTLHRIFKVQQ